MWISRQSKNQLNKILVFFLTICLLGLSVSMAQADTVPTVYSPVWISIEGCSFQNESSTICSGKPKITFSAEASSETESIRSIQGSMGSKTFDCSGSDCSFWLDVSGDQGEYVTFQGVDEDGAVTPLYEAVVRVKSVDASNDIYSVEVLSSQWRGNKPASCADIWLTFPESAALPGWLSTSSDANDLNTSLNLYYLAAALINHNLVDASSCSENGLADTAIANECGLSAAMPKMLEWQNQFDPQILSTAKTDDVPAQLIKKIFIRESQLWPGTYHDYKEVGLGQLTQNGADTVLLWNPEFYTDFCPTVLSPAICSTGYASLNAEYRLLLQGSLVNQTNADCPSCANGYDPEKTNFSIHVFAEALRANCSQVNQVIYNATGKPARQLTTYTDLWRLTLANYNAGSGCLTNAIRLTHDKNETITWANVSSHLDDACQTAIDYVASITTGTTQSVPPTPTPTAVITSLPAETESTTPTPQPTPTANEENTGPLPVSPNQ